MHLIFDQLKAQSTEFKFKPNDKYHLRLSPSHCMVPVRIKHGQVLWSSHVDENNCHHEWLWLGVEQKRCGWLYRTCFPACYPNFAVFLPYNARGPGSNPEWHVTYIEAQLALATLLNLSGFGSMQPAHSGLYREPQQIVPPAGNNVAKPIPTPRRGGPFALREPPGQSQAIGYVSNRWEISDRPFEILQQGDLRVTIPADMSVPYRGARLHTLMSCIWIDVMVADDDLRTVFEPFKFHFLRQYPRAVLPATFYLRHKGQK